jgi:hypothetical protein
MGSMLDHPIISLSLKGEVATVAKNCDMEAKLHCQMDVLLTTNSIQIIQDFWRLELALFDWAQLSRPFT